jgi:hypothetical protein
VIIAILGVISFFSMFVGTALTVVFFGFDLGLRVFFASTLMLIFCLAMENMKQ